MDDKLERILEEGIATYAGGEPLAGLEERILGRIAAAERRPRWRMGWLMALGGTVAATVLLFIPYPNKEEKARPIEVAAIAKVETVSAVSAPVQTKKKRRHSSSQAPLPKLAVFPSPTPLTADERGLMALMARDPEGTLAAFESLQKRSEPLQIEELKIQPLENGGGQ